MKKLISFFLLLTLCTVTLESQAQKEYKFANRKAIATLTSDTLISVTPKATMSLYYLSATHAIKFNAVTTYAVPGDLVIFKVKATSANRAVVWNTNLTAVTDTVASGKTKTYFFVYTGSSYDIISSAATD